MSSLPRTTWLNQSMARGMMFDVADTIAPPAALYLVDNMLPGPQGAVTRRFGRQRKYTTSAYGAVGYDAFRWLASDGTYRDVVYYAVDGGEAQYSTLDGGGVSDTITPLTGNTRSIGMQAFGRLYLCNGADAPVEYAYTSSVQHRQVGLGTGPAITSLTPANGGTLTLLATYSYVLTVLYGPDGESNPGTATPITLTGTQAKVTVAWSAPTPPAGLTITGYRVWRKLTSNSPMPWDTWYLVGQTASTSYADGVSLDQDDATVYADGAGTRVQDNHNGPPNALTGMVWWDFENRAAGWGEANEVDSTVYPQRLWFSDRGNPEIWRTTVDSVDPLNVAQYIDVPQVDEGNPIICVLPLRSYLYVFNRYGVRLISVDSDGNYQVVEVANSRDHGILGAKAACVTDTGEVFYLSTVGLRVIRGREEAAVDPNPQGQAVLVNGGVSRTGNAIASIVAGIPPSLWKHIHAIVFADQVHIALATGAVSGGTPTRNNDVLIFDLRTKGFYYSTERDVNGWCVQNDSGNPYRLESTLSTVAQLFVEYVQGYAFDQDGAGEESPITWRLQDFGRAMASLDVGQLDKFIVEGTASSGNIQLQILIDGDSETANRSFSYSVEIGLTLWQDSGYLTTTPGAANTTLAAWQAVTDGDFSIDVDGVTYDVDALDFSPILSMDDVADVIETRLSALVGGDCQVVYDSNEDREWFRITSNTTGTSSTVDNLTTGGGGTDISGAGFMGGQGDTFTPGGSTLTGEDLVWAADSGDEGVADRLWSAESLGVMRGKPKFCTFNGERGSIAKVTMTGTNDATVWGWRLDAYRLDPRSAR